MLQQAQREFEDRGLFVNTAHLDELMRLSSSKSIENNLGKNEITVVNIQKFKESNETLSTQNDRDVQRIYFIDESHRVIKNGVHFYQIYLHQIKMPFTLLLLVPH